MERAKAIWEELGLPDAAARACPGTATTWASGRRMSAQLAELGEQGRFDEAAARLMGRARPVERGEV